ncbi:MAG: hypothetical protein OEZ01_14535, partial [Candidatus Heimdallarchaeota archaeon]|nr:hypothetical protein [Candidatus Heimdallarchaeota archaeon]
MIKYKLFSFTFILLLLVIYSGNNTTSALTQNSPLQTTPNGSTYQVIATVLTDTWSTGQTYEVQVDFMLMSLGSDFNSNPITSFENVVTTLQVGTLLQIYAGGVSNPSTLDLSNIGISDIQSTMFTITVDPSFPS